MNLNPLKKDEQQEVTQPFMYTEDQLMARLKFFIGICLSLTLTGIVFVVLYSIIFVTQPLNAMSPIDQKFFELLIPISTFLTGILSGIMLAGKDDKEAKMKAIEAATRPTPVSPNSSPGGFTPSSPSSFNRPSTFGAAPSMPAPPNAFMPPPPPNLGPAPPNVPPGPPNLPTPPLV
jgi:hypothetical protein